MLYEIGLMPAQVDALLLRDFSLVYTGYMRRQEKEVNQTRHILAFIKTFSGMGATEFTEPKTLWPLEMDNEDEKKMITSLQMAIYLLKEF